MHPAIAKYEVTKHILKTFDIRASKKLGQNFLIDESIVREIIGAADLSENETVLEIGPGIGTLTQALAETKANVVAVELDNRLLGVLRKTLAGYDNIRVIHGDILKINIPEIVGVPEFKVVANLPYYITTPILLSLLEQRLPITRLVTMVQKEVAERMAASPGKKDYGALSVAVQYYTEPKIIAAVPPRSFIPSPAVDSIVICCDVRKQPPVKVTSEKMFFRVVKGAFSQRRKTLNNALKTMGLPGERVKAALALAQIDGERRGETLSLTEFAQIANHLSAEIQS